MPPTRKMSKTPMFSAIHSARYSRQELIKAIDRKERTSLICYVAGAGTEIDRDDVLGFIDLLHNIGPGQPVDLMLHTCGGDVDACEKLIRLIQANVGEAPLRVIIPDMAKSAGTLIALAAQMIILSESSELGMIDPQFEIQDRRGNAVWYSVVSYLKAYDDYVGMLSTNPKDTLALAMLEDFDAKTVAKFRGILDRVRVLAEGLLKSNQNPRYTAIAYELMDSTTWRTHGQPVRHADAHQIGLPVESVPMHSERWQRYWMLYCLQREEIGRDGKIFESAFVSQTVPR